MTAAARPRRMSAERAKRLAELRAKFAGPIRLMSDAEEAFKAANQPIWSYQTAGKLSERALFHWRRAVVRAACARQMNWPKEFSRAMRDARHWRECAVAARKEGR